LCVFVIFVVLVHGKTFVYTLSTVVKTLERIEVFFPLIIRRIKVRGRYSCTLKT
jgi:hypothetical protein